MRVSMGFDLISTWGRRRAARHHLQQEM